MLPIIKGSVLKSDEYYYFVVGQSLRENAIDVDEPYDSYFLLAKNGQVVRYYKEYIEMDIRDGLMKQL